VSPALLVDAELQKTIVQGADMATLVKAIADLVEVKGNLASACRIPGDLEQKIRAVVRHGTVADLIPLARTVVQPPPPTLADPQPPDCRCEARPPPLPTPACRLTSTMRGVSRSTSPAWWLSGSVWWAVLVFHQHRRMVRRREGLGWSDCLGGLRVPRQTCRGNFLRARQARSLQGQ
jgi:hypothetical protein